MHSLSITEIFNSIDTYVDDPRFFSKAFSLICKVRKHAHAKDGDNLKRVCAEEYDDLSRYVDNTRVQDSVNVRNILRTRRLANLLINDKGELHTSLLSRVITHVRTYLYSLGPQRQHDTRRQEHLLRILTELKENKELVHLLHRISKPHLHPQADQLIRDTLQLTPATMITDAHTRRAALAALLSYLRQSVGSCFGTAPAIIIHDEQPELFLTDIYDLLGTGRLKRTFGGIEYSVPLNTGWGAGDLRRHVLLSKYEQQEQTEIWYAPGMLVALEAAGLIKQEDTTIDKIEAIHQLVLKAFPEWNQKNPFFLTTAEGVLRRILLYHYGLTEQDIQAYEKRPRGMIQASLFMQPSATSLGMGGKGDACSQFYYHFERANSAFKAFTENALLKAWEYTIASFSETKAEFTRWNLYSSLGLEPEEPGGIGQALYEIIKQKLEVCNQKVSELQFEYEHLFAQLKQLEVRARHPSNDSESQWTRVEYQTKSHEFYTLEEMRDAQNAKAKRFTQLFNQLISFYDQFFPRYFQEVYDPELREVSTGIYDDSPAGFRLLYKHGRSNTSQWTSIYNHEEFIESLARFFIATETEVVALDGMEGMQNEISEIITMIVNHVRTQEFLETAFKRMAKVHRVPFVEHPLDNLDKIQAKPWAYISGGTMATLVSCYYRREQRPTEVARWVESPMELLVFLIDVIKHIPYKLMQDFLKNPDKSMLMHSPTHAFLFKPGVKRFKEGWQAEAYTYTWVRDTWVLPMERFVENISLDEEMMDYLIQKLCNFVPVNYQPYFRQVFLHMPGEMSTRDFRDYVMDRMLHERGLQSAGVGVLAEENIDSVLYNTLPLFPCRQLPDRIQEIFSKISNLPSKDQLAEILQECSNRVRSSGLISAEILLDACQAIACILYEATALPVDLPSQLRLAAQELGYIMPAPIIFADSNWSKDAFGFVINPGTHQLDLWRVDFSGRNGVPMSSWKMWLDGSHKESLWGIYTRPFEYTPGSSSAGIKDKRNVL